MKFSIYLNRHVFVQAGVQRLYNVASMLMHRYDVIQIRLIETYIRAKNQG